MEVEFSSCELHIKFKRPAFDFNQSSIKLISFFSDNKFTKIK